MAEYSLENLPERLEYDDRVLFKFKGKKYSYKVKMEFLRVEDVQWEQPIFLDLGINSIRGFLGRAYGYSAGMGGWPQYNDSDYSAATRAVWNLYGEILKKSFKVSQRQEFIDPKEYLEFF